MSDMIEAIERALAIHFSQNRQPHMSGDPRERLSAMQRRNMEDARDAVIAALGTPIETLRGLRDGSLVAVPAEPDEIITDAIREAWRNTRVGGVCGMSLEAQWRNGFAREIAAYRAMLAAAQEAPR